LQRAIREPGVEAPVGQLVPLIVTDDVSGDCPRLSISANKSCTDLP
jgi:hypothetical protein